MKKITTNCAFWVDDQWKNIKQITSELGYDNIQVELYKDINSNYIAVVGSENFVIENSKDWIESYDNFLKKLNNKLKLYYNSSKEGVNNNG